MELKEKLRKKFLSARKASKDLSYSCENEIIVKKTQEVISSILFSENKLVKRDKRIDILDTRSIIGLYWPMYKEVDLMKLAVNFSSRVALPKIKGTKMYYVQYNHSSRMEKSRFSKLMQPENENKVEPSIIVIPALSLSLKGQRLGFGAGYYDKYINKKLSRKNVIKIGVCFHENISEYLPQEKHDLTLDYVITDKVIIKI